MANDQEAISVRTANPLSTALCVARLGHILSLADSAAKEYNAPAMKTALVHDWLNQIGGAENVLETLVDLFPGAPVYTSIYAPKLMPASFAICAGIDWRRSSVRFRSCSAPLSRYT